MEGLLPPELPPNVSSLFRFGFVIKVCERETFGRWDAAHIVVGVVAPKLEHLARSRNYSERAACAIRAQGCHSHMTSAKFSGLQSPSPCHTHATYQYYHHVLANPPLRERHMITSPPLAEWLSPAFWLFYLHATMLATTFSVTMHVHK